jgi:hypothetical protein
MRFCGAVNVYTNIFSNYVFKWEYCIVFSLNFLYNWHMVSLPDLDWYYMCCVFCVVLFFCVMVQFSVLLYSSVLQYCSLLFILLCSSSHYVCVFDCIYRTVTLPPGVNPVALNTYLSAYNISGSLARNTVWRRMPSHPNMCQFVARNYLDQKTQEIKKQEGHSLPKVMQEVFCITCLSTWVAEL